MTRSAFCSASCSKTATQNAPGLLAVPSDDPTFTLVANQFTNEWKHTATPPAVRFVYRIVMTNQLKDPFEKRRDSIERRHNFKSQGMLEANERRRWHGTRRECRVGDPGSGALTMCNSATCYICIIMRTSFDVSKCGFGCLFGRGIYTSGTSSKSDTYVTQVASSQYKAMLMTRVLAGNATKFTVPDPTLVSAPPGYDAIRGVPGSGLLYDELIVYDNDQVRPFYLVIYDNDS
ncbi:hypothetical protein FS837_007268 [Tulasnella sp. UAMH 9824]|nr:hypothetical protein FS837_007268 [Tulasnella sp. UAMH 9824]